MKVSVWVSVWVRWVSENKCVGEREGMIDWKSENVSYRIWVRVRELWTVWENEWGVWVGCSAWVSDWESQSAWMSE